MKLNLSISTCPNDTFMFDALIHGRIDCRGYEFELTMHDIELLNRDALMYRADISKISAALMPAIASKYAMLNSGAALGRGNGPLLVSSKRISTDELRSARIAIPGKYTTAAGLLKKAFGENLDTHEYLFSDISTAILSGEVDAGVLIHEERFIYADKGLQLVADLGNIWEQLTGCPIPLGAIVVKRSLEDSVRRDIDELIGESVSYAMANPHESRTFVKMHARELDDKVIDSHIEMFVNQYSINMNAEGRAAVETLTGMNSNDIFI